MSLSWINSIKKCYLSFRLALGNFLLPLAESQMLPVASVQQLHGNTVAHKSMDENGWEMSFKMFEGSDRSSFMTIIRTTEKKKESQE
jgi:hypothetical protein